MACQVSVALHLPKAKIGQLIQCSFRPRVMLIVGQIGVGERE